ncbi:fungal-specific transcription factor domain-containing protein [Desarmillaria tabescens]|uniref:Fungal-specific transcription factor domain-containing protein n=1 Tax=Armillaria tabescens TaxID=1929756 RepID=A0AA39JI84_ARMTA|nr:fungal-specific transcription factor domain-containing protein [Desarmillaria tabescens]KAK0441804.1 fungal-specific transcription factor domain-containing protein [Desarmillaria tabescens]
MMASYWSEEGGIATTRIRNLKACDICRKKKVRCDRSSSSFPGKSCTRCKKGNLQCTYVGQVEGASSMLPRYINQLESKAEAMEQLLRKILPPETDLDKELEEGDPRSSVITELLQSYSRDVSDSDAPSLSDESDIDAALESNLERFQGYVLGYRFHGKSSSAHLVQTALDCKLWRPGTLHDVQNFTSMRPEFWCIRPWHDPSRYLAQYSLFSFPEDDLLTSLIDLYFTRVNIFFPLLHRPTLERSVIDGRHFKDASFAAVLLAVCAVASRYSDDPRVLVDETSKLSSGWKWANQVIGMNRAYPGMNAPSLLDAQLCCLLGYFVLGSSVPHQAWITVGIGLRIAQDAGAHRKRPGDRTKAAEGELWKRAFWCLVSMDRLLSSALGRPCMIYDEDIDVALPTECDDEYWEHSDPQQMFTQPAGQPSAVSYFNYHLRLTRLLVICLRTIYSIRHSKVILKLLDENWEQQIVVELDSGLNKWMDSLPEHLRWDPARENLMHFNQSAALHLSYYHVQMLIHRPFITAPEHDPSKARFPSLAICTNAARSYSRVAHIQSCRSGMIFPVAGLLTFNAAIVLLFNMWGKNRPDVGSRREMDDVLKCMEVLADMENGYHYAGLLSDILYELTSANCDGPSDPPVSSTAAAAPESSTNGVWPFIINPQADIPSQQSFPSYDHGKLLNDDLTPTSSLLWTSSANFNNDGTLPNACTELDSDWARYLNSWTS